MKVISPHKISMAGRQIKLRPGVAAATKPKDPGVEQKKSSSRSLKDSELRYRRLFEAAQDGILILDAQTGAIDDVNPYLIDLLGYSRAEFVEKKLWEVGAFRDVDVSKIEFKVLQATGYIRYENLPLRAKGGNLIDVEFVSNVYQAGDRQVIQCNIRNITARKRLDDASQESDKLYRHLFENMLNGFAYCKMIFEHGQPVDFIYLDVNSAFESLTGLKGVTGKKVSEVIPGIRDSDPGLFEIYSRVALSGKPERFETYVEALQMWFSISVYSPEREYFVAVFEVITERKRAEEEIKNLARFPDENPFPILRLNDKGIILYANTASRPLLEDWKTSIGREAPSFWRKIVTEAFAKRSKQRVEVSIGSQVLSFVVTPIIEASYVNLYGRDITDRKHAEDELQKAHDGLELQVQQRTAALSQSNMLLQTLLDNMPDQIYFKDAQSRFMKNSMAQVKLFGFSDPLQVVGKTDFDFFPHAQRSYEGEQEIIRSGTPLVDYEEKVIWPDGHETWLSTTKVPLRDHTDKIIGTMGISRDITDRKRNEEALQKTQDELQSFSYSVSHDLRAPLRGIDGWSLALLEDYGGMLDQQGKEYIRRVRAETQHMGELIDDLLQLSRITRIGLHTEQVDLSAIAGEIAARLQENEPQRHVEFIIQKGLTANGDAHLLEVALTNLLQNAFKFTGNKPQARIEFGQIEIKSERVFFVRDNGAGFDMTFAKKLFGAFQRMHAASEFPGTGIGLATVQRIVYRHGGRIWAESIVNGGATFFFTLEAGI